MAERDDDCGVAGIDLQKPFCGSSNFSFARADTPACR